MLRHFYAYNNSITITIIQYVVMFSRIFMLTCRWSIIFILAEFFILAKTFVYDYILIILYDVSETRKNCNLYGLNPCKITSDLVKNKICYAPIGWLIYYICIKFYSILQIVFFFFLNSYSLSRQAMCRFCRESVCQGPYA